DGKNLIDDQDLRFEEGGHGKCEAYGHSRTVTFYRRVDITLATGEFNDLVEFACNFFFGHAKDRAIEVHIFASCELRMEAGAFFKKGSNTVVVFDIACCWGGNF